MDAGFARDARQVRAISAARQWLGAVMLLENVDGAGPNRRARVLNSVHPLEGVEVLANGEQRPRMLSADLTSDHS